MGPLIKIITHSNREDAGSFCCSGGSVGKAMEESVVLLNDMLPTRFYIFYDRQVILELLVIPKVHIPRHLEVRYFLSRCLVSYQTDYGDKQYDRGNHRYEKNNTLAQVNHHRDRDFAADRDHHGDPQYGNHKEAAELLQQGHADSEHHKTKRQELPVMVIPESEGCRPYPHPHRDQDPEHDIKRVSGKIPDVQPGKGQQGQYKGENNVDNKENIECPNEKGVFLPGEKIMPYIFPRPRRIRVPVFIKTVCAFWGRFLLKKQVYNEILELFFGYFHFCDQNYKKNYAEGFPKSCKSFKI